MTDHQTEQATSVSTLDRDVATAILDLLEDQLCWVLGLGWMVYDVESGRWRASSDAEAFEIIMFTMSAWSAPLYRVADANTLVRLATLKTTAKGNAVSKQIKGLLHYRAEEFDSHPDLLCVGNGVVDLRTGALQPHDPKLRLTRGTPTRYKPGATHQDWDTALSALPEESREWFQDRVGQGVTGYPPPDDQVVFLYNAGSGAKTTIIDACVRALGDHMRKLPEGALLGKADEHAITETRGARLVYIEELPEGAKVNTKALKDLAGTGEVSGRRLYQDTMVWRASHSLLITTNHKPRVPETDHGTWRRMALLRFPYTFVSREPRDVSERRQDRGLRDRLRNGQGGRAEAVLAWAVAGAVAWYKRDRVMAPNPQAVLNDTTEWRGNEDLIAGFVGDVLEFAPDQWFPTSDMYTHFRGYLEMSGRATWSQGLFAERFEAHEMVANRIRKDRVREGSQRVRVYRGVTLRSCYRSESDFEELL